MLKVGLTGGMGSGKSTVAQIFETLGIPVLYADNLAQQLVNTDAELMQNIIALLGQQVYTNNIYQKDIVASIIFNDAAKLKALNALIHPVVTKYSLHWMNRQTAAYCIKEAALFFESGTAQTVDFMIGISAPEALRIERVKKRSLLTDIEIKSRMALQWDEAEKMDKCDAIICNDATQALLPQVLALHEVLLKKSNRSL